MPVYVDPGLLDDVSPELRKRMQGKSCFNFTSVDEPLFAELGDLDGCGRIPGFRGGRPRRDGGDARRAPGAKRPATGPRSTAVGRMGDTSADERSGRSREATQERNVAKVTMPQLGESVAEGTIGKWLKQPGDHVAKYEPLARGHHRQGQRRGAVAVRGRPEARSSPRKARRSPTTPRSRSSRPPTRPAARRRAPPHRRRRPRRPRPTAAAAAPRHRADDRRRPAAGSDGRPPDAGPAPATGRPARAAAAAALPPRPRRPPTATPRPPTAIPDARMTPAVRRLLREHGLTAAQIVGTGGGGRITREDVLAVVESIRTGEPAPAAAAAAATARPPPPRRRGPAPRRRRPRRAAGRAGTPPASPIEFPDGADEVLAPDDPDAQGHRGADDPRARRCPTPTSRWRSTRPASSRSARRPSATTRRARGSSLSYVPFVVKAAVEALKRNPTFNAHWTDDGPARQAPDQHGRRGRRRRRADRAGRPRRRPALDHGLNRAIADVADRARADKLRLDDFGGGTFTVDNTGWFGSNLSMPIINVPEVAIVTMEAITKRAGRASRRRDGDVIAIRPVMNMVLGVDHRANDGAGGAAFLRDIKAWLEARRDRTRRSTESTEARPRGAAVRVVRHRRRRVHRPLGRRRAPARPGRRRRRPRPRPATAPPTSQRARRARLVAGDLASRGGADRRACAAPTA